MRQFDVIVLEENSPLFNNWIPPFEDPALGWLHDSDWNRPLQSIDAEWVVITQPAVKIDREFLNSLAECIEGFPMVDAFAPRVKFEGHFYGGLLLNGAKGFAPISENEKMRFVAAPSPDRGIFEPDYPAHGAVRFGPAARIQTAGLRPPHGARRRKDVQRAVPGSLIERRRSCQTLNRAILARKAGYRSAVGNLLQDTPRCPAICLHVPPSDHAPKILGVRQRQ